jgi:hypothetical protein
MHETAARDTVAVFARLPVPGRCKTRLIPALGERDAAELYRCMLEDTLASVSRLPVGRRVLMATPGPGELAGLRSFVPPGWELLEQRGATLGERMASAVSQLARSGAWVALLGSDAPLAPLEALGAALNAHRPERSLLVGPAHDGGYWTIALDLEGLGALEGIPWSTGGVMAATERRAAELGLRLHHLPPAHDVDEPADLDWLRRACAAEPGTAPATAAFLEARGSRIAALSGQRQHD